jgi:hypothetical protein
MKKFFVTALVLVCAFPSWSSPILYDWGFNINGTTVLPGNTMPGLIDDSKFDWTQGLGTLSLKYAPGSPGDYTILSFFDHELDQYNNTFFNEYGSTSGTPKNGQLWEIDEPGWNYGDIYAHLTAGSFDKSNGVPSGKPDDVSMGMGWQFNLAQNQYASIDFTLSDRAPSSGFFLSQNEPASNAAIFFSSSLRVQGSGPVSVPEPGIFWMMLAGLLPLAFRRRK